MRKIMVANPKGGCGKSTVAVHLATWFARSDEVVYLGDLDRQQSSRFWLEQRPQSAVPIRHWPITDEAFAEPPGDCNIAILDTPAGLHGKPLKALLREVDRVVVPVSPSRFDMQASQEFFHELAETKVVRKERVDIAIIGMRVDARTQASKRLVEFLQQFDLPLLTCIRNAQRYVAAIDSGLTFFDAHASSGVDREQWQPLLDWLISRR
jgi:chromosome partitioning protein